MKQLTRIIALILVMVLALSACGKKDESPDKGGLAELLTDTTPVDDPAAYLEAAAKAAMDDIHARYSGSPIAALSGLSGRSGALEFTTSVTENGETSQLGGTASFDLDAGRLLLDAYISYMDQQVDASIYLDRDYLGVSVPMLLGGDAYYGFATHDLYGQASQSVLGQYMGDEALESFRAVDAIIDAFRSMDTSSMGDLSEKSESISQRLRRF